MSPAPHSGCILYVDLSSGRVERIASTPFTRDYLGGRGLAARLAWDLIPPGMGPYDLAAPLIFMPGAVVGTPAPSSGRTSICGLSPQAHPHEWYTRSNLGGHWGAELRYAGYDGLVVTGRAPAPVVLQIEGTEARLRDARHLWGLGIIETQRRLQAEAPEGTRSLAIGPAGERLCRYAIVATGTESAAGQGGFGAVMGSKNLKAITVRGASEGGLAPGVRVARPHDALARSRRVVAAILRQYGDGSPGVDATRPGQQRRAPCTHGCPRACGGFYAAVPGGVHPERTYSGHLHCCSPIFVGKGWLGTAYSFEAGFEIAQTCNDLGINHWEIVFGLVPWIQRLQARGEMAEIRGFRLDLQDPSCLLEVIRRIGHREGCGDLFAEGIPRAAAMLGVGLDLVEELYPAWGQASHWDGHGAFPAPYYPYWLVTALQWALDSRDPLGGGHGYTTNVFRQAVRLEAQRDDPAVRERLRTMGQHLYGSGDSTDPLSDYAAKAAPGVFHQDRNALKDCLGVCDNIFPMLTDHTAADLLFRLDGVDGRDLEHYVYEPLASEPLDREAFERVGTRTFTLERLLARRNWGRTRQDDETVIPYLSHPERAESPYVGRRVELDPDAFRALLSECYLLRGWDPVTGHPRAETLRTLGLDTLPDLV